MASKDRKRSRWLDLVEDLKVAKFRKIADDGNKVNEMDVKVVNNGETVLLTFQCPKFLETKSR